MLRTIAARYRRIGALEIRRNCGSNAPHDQPNRPHAGANAPLAVRIIRMRPRLFVSAARRAGRDRAAVRRLPDWRATTKLLVGWDLGIALYLALAFHLMARSDLQPHPPPRRDAGRRRSSRCWCSRRGGGREPGGDLRRAAARRGAAFASLHSSSWRPSPSCCPGPSSTRFSRCTTRTTITATARAHHRRHAVPGEDKPDYWDFGYFSFIIGMYVPGLGRGRSPIAAIRRTGRWRMG